VLDIADSYAP